ncbi:CrcB-like protein-domain-containing protein [Dissophora ornata]|nr:CrcB-like protein-domain-containing protein [Dissophora ornata]
MEQGEHATDCQPQHQLELQPYSRRQRQRSLNSTELLQIEEGAQLPPSLEAKEEEADQSTVTEAPVAVNLKTPPRPSIISPALIIPFSILGLYIRLGLLYIETFAAQQVFALAWPQFIGCLLMGLFVSTRPWIDQGFVRDEGRSKGHWIGCFVYVALTSGLCGSITSFSSWSVGIFVELINTSKAARHPMQNILSAFAELVVTLALSMTGLQLGTHLGQALLPPKPAVHPPSLQNNQTHTAFGDSKEKPSSNAVAIPPSPPSRWTIFDAILIFVCVIIWMGMVMASIFMPKASQSSWQHVVLAACFSPPGAILRWYLSRFNSKFKGFPIGTFAVNVGGSIILAVIICLQHTPSAGGKSALICQMLTALQDGFCGCLTTVSTFALELRTLPRKASYIYGIVSVVVAQLAMLVILGSFVWTRQSNVHDDSAYQQSMCTM